MHGTTPPTLLALVLLGLAAGAASSGTPVKQDLSAPLEVCSGMACGSMWGSAGRLEYTLAVQGRAPLTGNVPVVRFGGWEYGVDGETFKCSNASMAAGTDAIGPYHAVTVPCEVTARGAGGPIPIHYSILAYNTSGAGQGHVVFDLSLPDGLGNISLGPGPSIAMPPQFAPFPSFPLTAPTPNGLLGSAMLCYAGDKSHLFTTSSGLHDSARATCSSLVGSTSTFLWANPSSPTGMASLIYSPLNHFFLNYGRISGADSFQAKLFHNAARNDTVFCASSACEHTQTASGYKVLSANEGTVKPCAAAKAAYFWWSPTLEDNCVTLSADAPSAAYPGTHGSDGQLCTEAGEGRLPIYQYFSAERNDHLATSSQAGIAFAKSNGYTQTGILAYIDPPSGGGGKTASSWTLGVSGEIGSVPAGFAQRSSFWVSSTGVNAAYDAWGAMMRSAHSTTKRDREDIFLQAMTVWTDNGAATLGVGWKTNPGTAAIQSEFGTFTNSNFSQVGTPVLGEVATQVRQAGVAPRGLQLDCWWYPVNATRHPFWCGLDWILPEKFYPGGTGGVRAATGVPLMIYFPAVCTNGGRWAGKYNWSDTAELGFLLPVSAESKRFFSDLFDFGIEYATPSTPTTDAWPGVWQPPAVKQGWAGTNVAAYETDFFYGLLMNQPELRTELGAAKRWMEGMHDAAAARNLTVQLCAGSGRHFLIALTMPWITQARASIDYDNAIGPQTMEGFNNWAAPDNAYIFWATRIAPSKDNFWSSYKNLSSLNYRADTPHNGRDAELHAVVAVLSTSVVGLGDWLGMVNGTLTRRLGRADGILLKPDRPLAPLDLQFGSLLPDSRSGSEGAGHPSLPGFDKGARAWATHATVAPEDPQTAPELATAPTRRLVSHQGVDAAMYTTVPASVAKLGSLLQYITVGVDIPSGASISINPTTDLYPPVGPELAAFTRSFHGPACINGSLAIKSGCVALTGPTLSASLAPCSAGLCEHTLSVWHTTVAPKATEAAILLGDLGAYVSLSGYRFRTLDGGKTLVVVGTPGEVVPVTTLRANKAANDWNVVVNNVTVGPTGRTVLPSFLA